MHVLFAQVLREKDLSKAGDLFSLDDRDIETDLTEVLRLIHEITEDPGYLANDNNQSVAEICITRVTSSIRETGSIEKHASALVRLLESCLKHNLRVTDREADPPHAKIASDIMSCIFLNYSKRGVMELALPVAVRFLHQGNKELSRNLSSYLSLAAIDNAKLLACHMQPIVDSIISGNKLLARVLPQIYPENREPLHDHMGALICLLPDCPATEKNSLLTLCGLVAKHKPRLLEKHILSLCQFLSSPATSPVVLQTFVDMAHANPEPFLGELGRFKTIPEQQPNTKGLVAQILGQAGKVNKHQAQECVDYLVLELNNADTHTLPLILREVKEIGDIYPSVLPDYMLEIDNHSLSASIGARIIIQQLKDICTKSNLSVPERRTASSQTEGIVTVITVGNPPPSSSRPPPLSARQQLISKNASTSTRDINIQQQRQSLSLSRLPRAGAMSASNVHGIARPPSNSVLNSVTTMPRPPSSASVSIGVGSNNGGGGLSRPPPPAPPPSIAASSTIMMSGSRQTSSSQPLTDLAVPHKIVRTTIAGSKAHDDKGEPRHVPTVTTTIPQPTQQPHASVPFNAIPFRDAVQQFCEKHLDKIKHYMDYVSARLPIPIKATYEESKSHKKSCKLHFICFGRGDHCLYDSNFFAIKTRQARTWVHLMFLSIQARSSSAVSQQDPSVGNLKATWDRIRTDSGNSFVRLVTSSFPSTKDQDLLISELQGMRFFDVFEYDPEEKFWACFLCIHPEKVTGLIQQDGLPVIEGQLKEKKGKWKFLKRWKTRHFTLSGAQITYSKKHKKATLPISQIQSVKAVRKGVREIPKAFEIFTADNTYVFKAADSKHAEQWVQALQIAVARTKHRDVITEFDIQTWAFGNRRASMGHPASSSRHAQTKL